MFPGLRYRVNFDDFIFIEGFGDNGKSILVDSIITPIIGADTIANIRYQDLEDKFCLAQIVGRRLNVSTENDVLYISENSLIKAISSGAIQQVRPIYSKPFSVKIFAVLLFCANKELLFGNISYAMKKRFKLVKCPNRFTDDPTDLKFKADPEIRDPNNPKTKELQQGMLALLVRTAERLYREKKLTPADLSAVEEKQIDSSHIRTFIDQFYVFDKNSHVTSGSAFESYRQYCSIEGVYDEGRKYWNDPSKYDLAAKNTAQLTRKLAEFYPAQLTLCKEAGERAIKGLKERPITEKLRLNGPSYWPIYLKEMKEQRANEQKNKEKSE